MVSRVVRRFQSERLTQTAAALSFATLLGFVPMIMVAASLIEHLPFASGIAGALERFLLANLLPEKAGAVITKVVGQFAGRTGGITLIGAGALAATALMQMLTIERAFNTIWRAKAPRSLARRVVIHAIVLVLGPLIFGASLVGITYLISASLGMVADASWVTPHVFRVLSFVFLASLLMLAYWGVPNRRVSIWHAGFGGVLAAAGFLGMQKLFAAYVVKFPTYTLVYGPFAAMPIFLIWLYASWTVILVGALITAELAKARGR